MKMSQIVFGVAIVISAVACAHNQKEAPSPDSRIKPSSSTSSKRDSASEYGNQGTRMGSPTDSSRGEQARSTSSSSGMAGQSDASLIGSPAWWHTHLTADGKPRP